MKITATKQSLLDALLVVSRAVSARAALQALSGILITADGEPRLRATDMELGLDVGLEGEIEGGGSVVLPGRLLVEVARSLPDGAVTLALREAEKDVEITAGSSKFHLRDPARPTTSPASRSRRAIRSSSPPRRCATRSTASRGPPRVTRRGRC